MIYAQLAAATILAAGAVGVLAVDLRLIRRQARWERRRALVLAERAADYPPNLP